VVAKYCTHTRSVIRLKYRVSYIFAKMDPYLCFYLLHRQQYLLLDKNNRCSILLLRSNRDSLHHLFLGPFDMTGIFYLIPHDNHLLAFVWTGDVTHLMHISDAACKAGESMSYLIFFQLGYVISDLSDIP
jgi:hypothetical protein